MYGDEVFLSGNEGTGDEIHIIFRPEEDVRLVLFAEVFVGKHVARKAHALSIGKYAAG